jgi:hypothetical protein
MANSDSTKTAADQSRASYADDAKARRVLLTDSSGTVHGIQYPVSMDGDSIYEKDVDVANSDIGTFSGAVTDLVNSVTSTISDTSSTNPKYLEICFNRPLEIAEITLHTSSGVFKNTKIIAKDYSEVTLFTIDNSADNTPRTNYQFSTEPSHVAKLRFEFHTTDTITLSFLQMEKLVHANTHIHALDETNHHVSIGALVDALKVVIEPNKTTTTTETDTKLNLQILDTLEEIKQLLAVNNFHLNVITGLNLLKSDVEE